MEFDTKASIVAEAWLVIREVEQWNDVAKYADLGFPLAYAHENGFATLSKQGQVLVEETYSIIRDTLGIEDIDYEDFEAMLDANIAMQEAEDKPAE